MPNNNNLSESEEMYLVTIHRSCEGCEEMPVPIPELAKALGVQPVSVNQMINKLAELGLVNYHPYKGVELTAEGLQISTRIVRHRRLWEVFLVNTLRIELSEAERLACLMEHITTIELGDQLDDFLGKPEVCVHGNPIPKTLGEAAATLQGYSLENLQPGDTRLILNTDSDPVTVRFLSSQGIQPGNSITVLAIGQQGERLFGVHDNRINLSMELVKKIVVSSFRS